MGNRVRTAVFLAPLIIIRAGQGALWCGHVCAYRELAPAPHKAVYSVIAKESRNGKIVKRLAAEWTKSEAGGTARGNGCSLRTKCNVRTSSGVVERKWTELTEPLGLFVTYTSSTLRQWSAIVGIPAP
ncbi:uncharacterized protein P884DRAFT_110148 [Thermothelomyces heterothallicus CBS 202.75]|uniref:uncharacterized protein n=1 Tax=Thermothelomyces heterothallicus CBS 202.75 TaxID=1149848 RepID=UPI0037428CA0